jgi:hypothetical protein
MKTAKNATKTSKTSHPKSNENPNKETAMKTKTKKKKTPATTPASPIALAPSTATLPTTASGSVAAVIAAVYPTTPPGDLPPAVGVPATPKDWKARPTAGRGRTRGTKLTKDQVTSAAAAAGEITKSATYATDFGPHAPSQATLGFLMNNSAQWRAEWEHASQYLTYAAEQRAAWDQAVLGQMDTLKQAFDFVASREPAVTEKYSATAKFLEARSAVAERAANTRKEKLHAKAKGADAVPATPEPAPAVSAPAQPANAVPAVAK